MGIFDFAQAHLFADELREFFRADFAEAFEPRDFRFAAEFLGCVIALGFSVAVNGFLLVSDAEQRRFQNIDVAVVDELLEEFEEIRDHQVADVHAVHVRVIGVLHLQRLHEII